MVFSYDRAGLLSDYYSSFPVRVLRQDVSVRKPGGGGETVEGRGGEAGQVGERVGVHQVVKGGGVVRPRLPLPLRHQEAPQQYGRPSQLPPGRPHCSTAAYQETEAEDSQHKRSNKAREIFPPELKIFQVETLLGRERAGQSWFT